MNWQRHHIEVVRSAATGSLSQPVDLLRQQPAGVGCDPLGLRIVFELQRRTRIQGEMDNRASQRSGCHPARWWP
jgi:hypothetical protein